MGLVISVSHDDYGRNSGGVQNVIRDERVAFSGIGWSYLHVSPAAPLPALAEPAPAQTFRFAVRLGPDRLGIVTAGDLVAALAALSNGEKRILMVIHHLLGHAPSR